MSSMTVQGPLRRARSAFLVAFTLIMATTMTSAASTAAADPAPPAASTPPPAQAAEDPAQLPAAPESAAAVAVPRDGPVVLEGVIRVLASDSVEHAPAPDHRLRGHSHDT